MKGVPRTASNVMARILRNTVIEALRQWIVQIGPDCRSKLLQWMSNVSSAGSAASLLGSGTS
jgi:hypothetical protein